MKKIFVFLFTVLIVLSANVFFSVKAETVFSTNKTEYVEEEPILVTAEGSGKDWVGIYLKTDVPGDVEAIAWYYVATEGNTSGAQKDIRQADHKNQSRAAFSGIPKGEYTVYLFENDGYTVKKSADITVNEAPVVIPPAPISANYSRSTEKTGFADGTVSITAGEGVAPDGYLMYWGNGEGPLQDYTALAPVKYTGNVTTVQMVKNTLIPKQADRLKIYAVKGKGVSETSLDIMLEQGINDYDFGQPLYKIQVISDIHLNDSDEHIHNVHFNMALDDIITLSPDSLGIFVNGDIADHGNVSEYNRFNEYISKDGVPPVYCAIGNHDLANGPYGIRLKNFLDNTEPGTDSVYFDKWVGGAHFIFLGSEAPGLNAELSKEQLDWFKAKLAENRDVSRPIYVFLHQGIMDTVAGTFEYQAWHGINQSDEFKAILKDYPEVILFSGHSHWEMDSASCMKERDENLPTIFNTAAGAYLWNDAAMETDIGIEGSQGYYIYAYKDKLLVLGRDFVNGKWIASAQFVVENLPAEDTVKAPNKKTLTTVLAVCGGVLALSIAGVSAGIILKKKKKNA